MTASKKENLLSIFWIFILLGGSLLLNLRWSPVYQELEADSGVYAYVGSAILKGELPYRDVWEHKPPIGLYLNAMALVIFGHTPWAIWWFNVIWIAFTTVVFFLLIKNMMGLLTGCLASLFFLAGVMIPELFQGGNLMEVYGLLPQVLIIWAMYLFFSKQQERWVLIAGLFTAWAFLTKQTTIALGVSSILAIFLISLLRHEFKQALMRLLYFALGMIAPIILAGLYWLVNGAAGDFLDAVFLHSLAYVGERASLLWSFKNTVLNIFPKLSISRLYEITAVAFVLYCVENFRWYFARLRRGHLASPTELHPTELTLLGVFIALPLEIGMASLGARNFGHYFLTLVPAGATVAAYILWKTVREVQKVIHTKQLSSWLSGAWIVLGLISFYWLWEAATIGTPNPAQLASVSEIFSNQYEINDLEKYIINTTGPDDRVLVWHIHTGINFITQRKAAARVLFPMNLFIGNQKMPEFTAEMAANPPELIVFQKPSSLGLPFVDENIDEWCDSSCMPEVAAGIKQSTVRKALNEFQSFFQSHYVLEKQIFDWNIYRYKN